MGGRVLLAAIACAIAFAAMLATPGTARAASGRMDVFRLVNPYEHDKHLYTSSATERDDLVERGWVSEGLGWVAPRTSDMPIYRLYNPYSHEHLYTTDKAEYDALVETGWDGEDVQFHSDEETAVPVYRLYNPYAGTASPSSHHFTTSATERDALVERGWRYEQVAWYGREDLGTRYLALGAFFVDVPPVLDPYGNETDFETVLCVTHDGYEFTKVGTPFTNMENPFHDPSIMYRDGYFYLLSNWNRQNGRFNPMLSYSQDLVTWSEPEGDQLIDLAVGDDPEDAGDVDDGNGEGEADPGQDGTTDTGTAGDGADAGNPEDGGDGSDAGGTGDGEATDEPGDAGDGADEGDEGAEGDSGDSGDEGDAGDEGGTGDEGEGTRDYQGIPLESLPFGIEDFDVVAPEWFLDDDGSVYILFSAGYFGYFHGEPERDRMKPYLVKVDITQDGFTPWTSRSGKPFPQGLTLGFTEAYEIQGLDESDNYIDGSLYKEDGVYYLLIKKDGVINQIYANPSLEATGWERVNDGIAIGNEGPSLLKLDDRYLLYTDQIATFPGHDGRTGTQACESSGLDLPFDEPVDVTADAILRHGTVIPLEGEARSVCERLLAEG